MKGFRLRPIAVDDLDAVNQVFYRTWLDTYTGMDGVTKEDIDARFAESNKPESVAKRRALISNLPSDQRHFVAESDGAVVGVCRLFLHPDKNQLQAIYVLPEFQGRGVGSALWEEAVRHFNPKLPTVVQVAAANDRAIGFYKRLGFKETGKTWSDEKFRMKSGAIFTETELVMEPEL